MIKIGIVDDHQIVIDGLKLLLNKHTGFKIVAESTSGAEMLLQLEQAAVDVLLIDIMMPEMDGYELALLVGKKFPATKILALSMNSDGVYIDKMIAQAGIHGYVLKTSDKDELNRAIESVAAGDDYYAEEILSELQSYQNIKRRNIDVNITNRELEIIQCIVQGMTNKQIADALFISEYTVETHRKNIFRKTNTRSAVALSEYARKQKLV